VNRVNAVDIHVDMTKVMTMNEHFYSDEKAREFFEQIKGRKMQTACCRGDQKDLYLIPVDFVPANVGASFYPYIRCNVMQNGTVLARDHVFLVGCGFDPMEPDNPDSNRWVFMEPENCTKSRCTCGFVKGISAVHYPWCDLIS
jgi:hypothetical protein